MQPKPDGKKIFFLLQKNLEKEIGSGTNWSVRHFNHRFILSVYRSRNHKLWLSFVELLSDEQVLTLSRFFHAMIFEIHHGKCCVKQKPFQYDWIKNQWISVTYFSIFKWNSRCNFNEKTCPLDWTKPMVDFWPMRSHSGSVCHKYLLKNRKKNYLLIMCCCQLFATQKGQ